MSLKKIIIGEPMPDKNDPKYKERYEREVEAGRKFAEKIKLPWLFGKYSFGRMTTEKHSLSLSSV